MTEKEFKKYPDSGNIHATKSKKFPNSPDYFGEIAIDLKNTTNVRVEDGLHIFKLGGWKKVGASGKTYLQIKVDRFIPTQTNQPLATGQDDDIPF
jgi:hypothetical protein